MVMFAVVGVLVALGIVAGMVIAPVRAQSTYNTIGYVDIQKALQAHPKRQAVYDQIAAFQQAKMDELTAMQNQNTQMTDAQRQALMDKYYQAKDDIDAETKRLIQPLYEDIHTASAAIGQESGVEVIIDGGFVLYGGLDLTPLVIQRLQSM
jgi:Skp family chaperone for outer membrane proteins